MPEKPKMAEQRRAGGMQYRYRRMRAADVPAVVDFCLRHLALPAELERELPSVFRFLLEKQLVFGGVVERLPRPGGAWQMAACGLSCYMADALRERYFARPFPFLTVHVLEQVRRRRVEEVMIERAEVSRRQRVSPPSLDLLVLFWLQDNFDKDGEDAWQVMFQGFAIMDRFLTGVRLRSIVFEGVERGRKFYEAAGYARLVDFSRQEVSTPYDGLKADPRYSPCIHGIYTTDDFRKSPSSSPVARMFLFREPILDFTDYQKMVLDLAVEGYSDKEIADILGLKPNAVRMRWRGIYDKMQAALPGIFSCNGSCSGGRGQEKRRIALRYVRDHPEEIRPHLVVPDR